MKQLFYSIAMLFAVAMILPSCTGVDPGHRGVEVSWGGETNMKQIYGEGLQTGFHWLFDDMVEYDCREKTTTSDYEFNDVNNMLTGVEIAVDWNLNPSQVNLLHTEITDVQTKLEKTIKSAGKEVIPNYSAVDLNLTKRGEAEEKLGQILERELPEFYLEFARVQITDVDIPKSISEAAKRTAEQIEKNKLAAEMAEEATNLGDATIADAKANATAAESEAKRLRSITSPAMLKYEELQIERLKWEGYLKHGTSPYGQNNVFGEGVVNIKGLGN